MTTVVKNTLLYFPRLFLKKTCSLWFGNSDTKDNNKEDVDHLHVPAIIASVFYLIVIFVIGVPVWYWTCSVTLYPLPDVTLLKTSINDGLNLNLDISVVLLDRSQQQQEAEEHAGRLRKLLPMSEVSVNKLHYKFNWRVRRPLNEELKAIQHQQGGSIAPEGRAKFLEEVESKLLAIHNQHNRFRLWIYVIPEQQYDSYCQKSHSFTLGFERFVFVCPSNVMEEKERLKALSRLIVDSVRETYLNSIDTGRINHLLSSQLDLVVNMIMENDDEVRSLEKVNKKADLIHSVSMKNVQQLYPELTEMVNIKVKSQIVFNSFDKGILKQALFKESRSAKQLENKTTDQDDSTDGVRLFDVKKSRQFINSVRSRISEHQEKHIYHLLLLSPSTEKPPIVFHQAPSTQIPGQTQSLLVGSDLNSMLIWNDDKDLVLGLRALYRHILGLTWTDLHSQCSKRDVFFTRWEIDSLLAGLTVTKLTQTSKSLESVKNLVEKVSKIVIEKEVAYKMDEAFELSLQSVACLQQGQIVKAYRLSSRGYDLSESAFFDPSLLELLYFPNDQKYAIYYPLFMPLAIPIGFSILRLIKTYVAYRRQSKNGVIKEKQG